MAAIVYPEIQRPAWIRDQILANARLLFPDKTVDMLTAREPFNVIRGDGSIETRQIHYASLYTIDEQKATGDGCEADMVMLLNGRPVMGTTEDALGKLLGQTEEAVHRHFKRQIDMRLGKA